MSGEREPSPPRRGGLLRGSRTRSYGSLIRPSQSPVHRRVVEHVVQPGETLQGLALKYGVSMEQIKRANRLYTNDSIFLKKSLSIPVLSDLEDCSKEMLVENLTGSNRDCSDQNGHTPSSSEKKKEDDSSLTPVGFLKRLDDFISQSKQAAAKGCQDFEKRVAALEAACSSGTSDWRPLSRSQSVISSSRIQPQAAQRVAVPLATTKLTKLKDLEDEIFEL
uniref:LysM and putative peptidoglycan-binding domain-containing protein 1 n=1 Tax=Nothobranchius korthausae TaxID=1143690 RepID=A0A1A8EZ04_9TELE